MGYSSSIWPKWFPWRPSSSWSGESEGSGGGGEWARARDWPGEPVDAFGSRSTTREMVGEVPVRSATAWSCLASVMSTPLIWIDNKTNHGRCQPTRTLPVITGNTSIQSEKHFNKACRVWHAAITLFLLISHPITRKIEALEIKFNKDLWVHQSKYCYLTKSPTPLWSKKNKKREKGAEGKRRLLQVFWTWQSFLEGYMQTKPFLKLVIHRIRQFL